MKKQSPILRIRVQGPLAIFTRPELKTERVSYPVPTPSAMRGLYEAICWKPAIRWQIERIIVLNDIRFTAFKRNEVNTKGVRPTTDMVNSGGIPPVYFADDSRNRAQRNTLALRDVDYQVEARFSLTDAAGDEDNITKFVEMFTRRLAKGQHYHQPYLGCRECAAEVMEPLTSPTPIDDSRDLGLMLWDLDFTTNPATPLFFKARLDHGVLLVPTDPLYKEIPS